MKKYLDSRQLTQFSKSLRKTRAHFGAVNISKMSPSYGIEGNTFRAYRGWKHSPSKIYREWAEKNTKNIITLPPTQSVSNEASFGTWHKKLYNSLNKHWKTKQDKALSLAHCYKLVDLYIKWLSQFDFIDKKFVHNLTKYASCALDSQTIERINQCYGHCLPICKPRMGDVINQNTYDYCQEIINEFCKAGGGTKLEFDYWAWKKGG